MKTIPDASALTGWRKSTYSDNGAGGCVEITEALLPDASELTGWRKSSHSDNGAGACVEVVDTLPSAVPVRDSKNPTGPALVP
jgi:uncharacterized protein DUF397